MFLTTGLLIILLFIPVKMDMKQTVKDLQAQNAQIQQMFLTLAKGQEDLKTLLIEEKKKKAKKSTGVLNLGRRFPEPTKWTLDFAMSSSEKYNQDGKGKEAVVHPDSEDEEEEEDYYEEQYPPADDKYKHLEERLSAMVIQKVPGLEFEELGLVSGIVIPPKFKAPVFAKYDGVSCPKMHLRSYVRKI